MRIILDTGVFFHPDALLRVRSHANTVVVPAVAYAERVRQLKRKGHSLRHFDQLLELSGILVEPFGRENALLLLALRITDDHWRRAARDALIASHVGPGDQLWTTNPKDFLKMGIAAARIVTVGGRGEGGSA